MFIRIKYRGVSLDHYTKCAIVRMEYFGINSVCPHPNLTRLCLFFYSHFINLPTVYSFQ